MARSTKRSACIALVAGSLLLASSCDKSAAATQPEPATAPAGDAAASATGPGHSPAETDGGAATDPESSDAPDIVVPVHEGEAGEATEGSEAAPDEVAPQDPTAEASTKADPSEAKLELPPPLFPKVREGCGNAPGVGQRVKSFKLATPEGKNIAPSYYRGRVVLLNFWGTWCKPCLKELPEFSRLYRRYRKYGLTLVAVATDEDAEAVKTLIREKKISAKVAVGGEATAGAYGDRNFPFTFVVDAKGVIRAAYDGYKEGCLGAVERDIRRQLEKRNG